MEKNKVKYNLRNVHYAQLLTNTAEGATYGDPVAMEGAVSISLEPEGEQTNFYADGYAYFTISNNTGYSGDLALALIPESFLIDILKEKLDEKKVLVEQSGVELGAFALMFEFEGDKKEIKHVFYNCSVSRPGIGSKTNSENIEIQTETLKLSISPLACKFVKAKVSDEIDEIVGYNWYKSVYFPDTPGLTYDEMEESTYDELEELTYDELEGSE